MEGSKPLLNADLPSHPDTFQHYNNDLKDHVRSQQQKQKFEFKPQQSMPQGENHTTPLLTKGSYHKTHLKFKPYHTERGAAGEGAHTPLGGTPHTPQEVVSERIQERWTFCTSFKAISIEKKRIETDWEKKIRTDSGTDVVMIWPRNRWKQPRERRVW